METTKNPNSTAIDQTATEPTFDQDFVTKEVFQKEIKRQIRDLLEQEKRNAEI